MADTDWVAEGFTRAARREDVPEGAGRVVEVAGWWVALFRSGERFYALDNACPHMAGPLGAGPFDGATVTCPLHGWAFDVRTGAMTTNEHVRVACYDVRADEAWIWVRTRIG